MKTIIVYWYCPFRSIKEASKTVKKDEFDYRGLYLGVHCPTKNSNWKLAYVGISESDLTDRLTKSEKLHTMRGRKQIWIGEIEINKGKNENLNLAEWMIAYFFQVERNEMKTKNPPPKGVVLINRFYKRDYETPRKRNRPIPEIIAWLDRDEELIWNKSSPSVAQPVKMF